MHDCGDSLIPAGDGSGLPLFVAQFFNLPPGQDAEAVVSGEPDPEKAFFRALYGGRRVRGST